MSFYPFNSNVWQTSNNIIFFLKLRPFSNVCLKEKKKIFFNPLWFLNVYTVSCTLDTKEMEIMSHTESKTYGCPVKLSQLQCD